MTIEKILFPAKFKELSYETLESLLVLEKAGMKEVVLCHVILRDDVGFVPFGGYLKEEEEKLRTEARIRLEDWQRSLDEKGMKSKIEIYVGAPVHGILVKAEEENVDLLVIGKKKSLGSYHSFLGPYGHEIVTRSKKPVLAISHIAQFNWEEAELTRDNNMPFEMPMVVVDWSDVSQRVIEFVSTLKGAVKKVLVFHNIDTSKLKDASDMKNMEMECDAKLKVYCDQLRTAGIDAEPHTGAGSIFEEIIRVSREREASMIIMGNTSGHRFLEKMLHRSISYEVARVSELPTLLVP